MILGKDVHSATKKISECQTRYDDRIFKLILDAESVPKFKKCSENSLAILDYSLAKIFNRLQNRHSHLSACCILDNILLTTVAKLLRYSLNTHTSHIQRLWVISTKTF